MSCWMILENKQYVDNVGMVVHHKLLQHTNFPNQGGTHTIPIPVL